ncbi:MAG: protein-methionine-sulfoxide reductase heme-binding subunit MsrQ [Kangiellaceae bacterium]|jgi:sulfoxide reductase heme-binding subunit YedZ|nr:protein-methionine-sulfoxide reductase heme-binding subunit MsrQ [Kangiellaceae bacterium]
MLKLAAHLLAITPSVYWIYLAFNQQLGADPQEVLLLNFGITSLQFLLLSLLVTPVRMVLKWNRVFEYRRMLGLYFFYYLILHVLTYLTFYLQWNFGETVTEIIERPYITVGAIALLLSLPLVATSTKAMQKKLRDTWTKLHRLTYSVALLGCVHYIWQTKADLNQPLLYFIVYLLLIGYRLYKKRPILPI